MYSQNGGNLSAAGMSFQALFAVFAGIWVSFSVMSIWLGNAPRLRQAIIDFINLQIPGLISKNGFIDPDTLLSNRTLSWTGIVAVLFLIWTAISWMDYARVAIHRMFGLARPSLNAVLLKVWDFALAVTYGLLVLIAAILSVFTTGILSGLLAALGVTEQLGSTLDVLARILSALLVLALDTATLALMLRVLSGVQIPHSDLWQGALLGGTLLGAMKIAGGALLGGATRNPLFASVAVFIGLLIWFNLTSRVFLLTAAWIATSMRERGIDPVDTGWVFPSASDALRGRLPRALRHRASRQSRPTRGSSRRS